MNNIFFIYCNIFVIIIFDKLVEHCESLRCRHLLFSHYFGDQPPDCKKRQLCDVCKDPKKAEKALETFHRLAMNSFSSKIMKDADFDDSDLYEGGRNAGKFRVAVAFKHESNFF